MPGIFAKPAKKHPENMEGREFCATFAVPKSGLTKQA